MLIIIKNIEKCVLNQTPRQIYNAYSTVTKKIQKSEDEFRVLNLKNVKGQTQRRVPRKPMEALPPRAKSMPIDQDWGSVWPGPRTFHPATVPLPLRQGYKPKGAAPPDKYANAELMKIPNFLHLTPPVIKRQCEALKQFCTKWPENLTDEKIAENFPLTVSSSDYCHSSPSIRDPMARIVTIKFKLSSLKLNEHARDKFLRLVGERYNEKDDTVTIVTDRCPLKCQNYEYAMYLLTALYHESWNVEPWEAEKSEADMEYYDWNKNASKRNVEGIFGKSVEEIENVQMYANAVSNLMNEGENEYTLDKYKESVKTLLSLSN